MTFKEKYLLAKKNGEKTVEFLRGDEISRRIARVYPLSAQISIIMDKDIKYNEWIEYQTFRSNIKIEVDNEIAAIEAEFYHGA